MAYDVKQAVDEMLDSFKDFKDRNDKRLDAIEREFDKLAVVQNRPFVGGGGRGSDGEAERKALATMVRTGDDGLLRDTMSRKAGLQLSDDTAGGYLLVPNLSVQIISALREVSPMRRLARIETIGLNTGGEFVEPKELTETGAEWVGETEERDDTGDPSFGATSVHLNELYALVPITQRMLDDSQFDVGAWLEAAIARKFARTEGTAYIVGDGLKKPRGIADYATDTAGDSTRSHEKWQHVMSGAAASVTADGLRDLYWALGASYRANSAWLMSSATAGVVDKLKDGNGDYLWRNSSAAGEPPTLLGRPVEVSEDMPAVASNALPIALGDWKRGYLILDRPGLRFLRDPYTLKGHVKFYTYKRTGGGASDLNAAKFLKVGT